MLQRETRGKPSCSTKTGQREARSLQDIVGGTISTVIWVLVFGGVALLGAVTAISYAVWLAHKASDLFSEVRILGQRAEEAGELLGRIQLPAGTHE